MLRAASAAQVLRRALSRTSPLLRDAAAQGTPSGWVVASSVERLGVLSALRAAPRRLSAAATAPSAVVCACVLERLPIVMPPRPAWETEYQVRAPAARAAAPRGSRLLTQLVAWRRSGGTRSCARRSRSIQRRALCAVVFHASGKAQPSAQQPSVALQELTEPKAVEDNENKTAWEPATLAQAPAQLRQAPKPRAFRT